MLADGFGAVGFASTTANGVQEQYVVKQRIASGAPAVVACVVSPSTDTIITALTDETGGVPEKWRTGDIVRHCVLGILLFVPSSPSACTAAALHATPL